MRLKRHHPQNCRVMPVIALVDTEGVAVVSTAASSWRGSATLRHRYDVKVPRHSHSHFDAISQHLAGQQIICPFFIQCLNFLLSLAHKPSR